SVAAADAPDRTAADAPATRAATSSSAAMAHDGVAAPPAQVLLIAYALVGFTALVYEVCWTRALALVLGSSIYAFSAMLGAFLVGIALGSLAVRRLVDRSRRPLALLVGGLVALGLASLAVTLALPSLPDAFLELLRRTGPIGTRL